MPANGRWDLIRRLKVKAVYTSYVYVHIFFTSYSRRLEYNSLFVGQGCWGVRGNVSHSLPRYIKVILLLLHLPLYFSVSKFPIVSIIKKKGFQLHAL